MLIIEEFTCDGLDHPGDLVTQLRSALLDFSTQRRDHPHVASAIWALSKFQDPELREFFVSEMRIHLAARRHGPVSQAEYGLLMLGELATGYDYSAGETCHDAYLDAVRDFLESDGAPKPVEPIGISSFPSDLTTTHASDDSPGGPP